MEAAGVCRIPAYVISLSKYVVRPGDAIRRHLLPAPLRSAKGDQGPAAVPLDMPRRFFRFCESG